MLQIGVVAKRSGIGVETIRYYEREGLIPLPERSASGYRRYPESVVQHLQFIQHAKTLGFTLKQIGELSALKNTPDTTCKIVRASALEKAAEIQKKINALETMKIALTPLIDQCRSTNPIDHCPILNTINDDTDS